MDAESLTANKRRRSSQENESAVKKKSCNAHPSSTISFGGILRFEKVFYL
jgi:hypothetical protein